MRKPISRQNKKTAAQSKITQDDLIKQQTAIFASIRRISDTQDAFTHYIASLLRSGTTIQEICKSNGISEQEICHLCASSLAEPPHELVQSNLSVILPFRRAKDAEDWLSEAGIEMVDLEIVEHDDAMLMRFGFDSEEDATLFRLRFL